MTAQEKPHWSAETARKNTVVQPLLCPQHRQQPQGKLRRPPTPKTHPRFPGSPRPTLYPALSHSLCLYFPSLRRRSSPFPRSFPRQLPPHVKGCLGSWYRGGRGCRRQAGWGRGQAAAEEKRTNERTQEESEGFAPVARLRRSCAHLNNAHNKVCNG